MTHRVSNYLRYSLTVVMFNLVACSQPTVKQDTAPQVRTAPYTIATSGDPSIDLRHAATYSWQPDMHAIHGTPTLRGVPVRNLLEAAINNALAAKGYRFVPVAAADGLLVGYRVILGDTASDERVVQELGLDPGMRTTSPDATRYTRGTLVISVIDKRTGRTAWRSSLQGFADLDIPASLRQQRIYNIVANMLAGLPARLPSGR